MNNAMNNFYRVTAQEDKTQPARLDLFGLVGSSFWDKSFDEAEFKESMHALGPSQPLDIFINSQGGSVFTAIAIYNQIAAHKGDVTIRVAGMAASAATIITSAPNAKVVMPKGSMMLVHPVRMATDSSTPEELKEAAENLEKVRQSVRDIYTLKTCLSSKELDDLMSKESYLTAEEAVELGFADELDETENIENTLSGQAVMVNGMAVSASLFSNAPKGFFKAEFKTETPKEEVQMNIEELKAKFPDQINAIRLAAIDEGVQQERARIQGIEAIATPGHEALVTGAKFGEATMTAEQLAVAILKADKARDAQMLANRAEDARGLDGIEAEGNTGLDTKSEQAARKDAQMQEVIAAGRRGFARQ